jgi:hypothetical protein
MNDRAQENDVMDYLPTIGSVSGAGNAPYLLVVLGDKLEVSTRADLPDRVRVGDQEFVEYRAKFNDFCGFYDWMADPTTGELIGVEFIPFPEVAFAAGDFDKYRYIESTPDSIRIFLTGTTASSYAVIAQQQFGGNKIYKSLKGGYAVSFDLGTIPGVGQG